MAQTLLPKQILKMLRYDRHHGTLKFHLVMKYFVKANLTWSPNTINLQTEHKGSENDPDYFDFKKREMIKI